MQGGDLFSSVADLTIPFCFLLGAQGVKYIKEKQSRAAHQTGGEAGTCFLCQQDAAAQAQVQQQQQLNGGAAVRAALREEIQQITNGLKELLADY